MSTNTVVNVQAKRYAIGDVLEYPLTDDMIPLDFGDVSKLFEKGERGFAINTSDTKLQVCYCKKVYPDNLCIKVIYDEGRRERKVFPDKVNIFKLDGILSPLDEYSVFGFKLGDVISDVYRHYPIASTANSTDRVFEEYSRARQTSQYVGGWVRDPQVGQMVAKFNGVGTCYSLAVIVHVAPNHVILRDSIDYATRRIKSRWGPNPMSMDPSMYVDDILRIRRLDWWMTASLCKCVPMLPHLQNRDWIQWDHSEILHLSDGTQVIGTGQRVK